MNYPREHPDSLKDGLIVYGLEIEQPEAFEYLLDSLSVVAQAADITMIPVYTNERYLDADWNFWGNVFEGAVFAAVGHALSRRLTVVSLASSYDTPNLHPHASHPLLDPNYSSYELRIRHDGIAFSRAEKTRLLAAWDVALKHLRVCNKTAFYQSGKLNCGRCEKCLRTMITLYTLGVLEQASAFPPTDLSAEFVSNAVKINHTTFPFYGELIAPLREKGRHDLARCIEHKLAAYHRSNWRPALSRIDQEFLDGSLKRLKQSIAIGVRRKIHRTS
jgi:hypothetical protein